VPVVILRVSRCANASAVVHSIRTQTCGLSAGDHLMLPGASASTPCCSSQLTPLLERATWIWTPFPAVAYA